MKFFGHLATIMRHRHQVMKNCFRCGLYRQGLVHDLSKYSPTEFWRGVKYYQGGHRSPNARENEIFGYSTAWLHHKGRNRHHFEYWTDYNVNTRRIEPVPMPRKYLIEMFCDRVAASKIYKGKDYTDATSLEYYTRRDERRFMHPETADKLEFLLHMLAEKGEKETFAYIKKNRKTL
ncbi:MAG: catalase [Clostridia bacterium]|nr:catalase [Clostridia bacterium]